MPCVKNIELTGFLGIAACAGSWYNVWKTAVPEEM
jgi:hypothetical protein